MEQVRRPEERKRGHALFFLQSEEGLGHQFPVPLKVHNPLSSTEAALDGACHGTSQEVNALYVRFSLYFSLIQRCSGRDELATDWPHLHISIELTIC